MSHERHQSIHGFEATSWSMVARAANKDCVSCTVSLQALLQRYIPALRAYLRCDKRLPADRAEDLLQGFLTDKILEQNLIARADREKGKFRSFLLLALNRYLIDQYRRTSAGKRSGREEHAPAADSEWNLLSKEREPPAQFDIAWSQELVSEVLRRMKTHCDHTNRTVLWRLFETRVIGPAFEGTQPPAYEELVQQFQLETPAQASNLLTTSKRLFARILREVVREYTSNQEEVEREIDDLWKIVARARA